MITFIKLLFSHLFVYCGGGGGGGGDGGAAEREAQRQARIQQATDAVNKLFGIGDDSAKTARDSIYSTLGSDTSNYFNSQLEEDKEDARRQLEFHKARTGLFGSSSGTDLDNKFQQSYDRGLLDIANRSDSASAAMKTSDEQARLGLLGKITSGIDQESAVSSALSQLQTNAENSKNQAMTGRMANVFADLVAGLNTGQYNAGAAAAKQQYGGNLGNYYPSATTGASGTVRPQ